MMKKIFLAFIVAATFLVSTRSSFAQGNTATVEATVAKMKAWQKADWTPFFNVFNSTEAGANAPHVKAMYELDAYLHAAATNKDLANKAASVLINALDQLKDVQEKNILVRSYLIERLGYVGSDKAVKTIASYIELPTFADVAAMSLATLHTKKSLAALEAALSKASPATKLAIEAAIKHSNSVLPAMQAV